MKKLLIFQATSAFVPAIAMTQFVQNKDALSYFVGALLVFLNLALSAWLWALILKKKLIALSVLIIVFKYSIFGSIIYFLLKSDWLNAILFLVGLSTLVPSVILSRIIDRRRGREGKTNVSI